MISMGSETGYVHAYCSLQNECIRIECINMRACAIAQPQPGRAERANTGREQNEYYICWNRLSEYKSLTISAACNFPACLAKGNVVAGEELEKYQLERSRNNVGSQILVNGF